MRAIWLLSVATPVLALAFVSLFAMPVKLIYNGSNSAPIGFYWLDQEPAARNDYVLAEVPAHVRELVEKRGYLPADIPLIKRVVGVEGDMVCRRDLQIVVGGVTVAVARKRDDEGRLLPDWRGCHRMTADDVFLLQDHHLSFDGRYFGPVKRSQIVGRLVKLPLLWQKRKED